MASPDQATPKEIKNPIHLKTRDLVFNKDSGNAFTNAKVEVVTPQASGWAMGVRYASKSHTLTLDSQVHLTLTGPEAATIEAQSGVITNEPREIVLDHPRALRHEGAVSADRATFHLTHDNHVENVFAQGNVWEFLDRSLELLAPGGRLLIGDVPNLSKRRRFFSSEAGIAYHRRFTGGDEPPQVEWNRPEPRQIDDAVVLGLLSRARAAGFDACVVPQADELPMANRREDLLIYRP